MTYWMSLVNKHFPAKLLLALSFFISISCQSQVGPGTYEKYYAEHFGEEEGLPQNSINNILPDKNDFLWIATESGITRFNGNRFLPVSVKAGVNSSKFTRVKGFYHKGSDTILAYSAASSLIATIVSNSIIKIEKFDRSRHGFIFSNMQYSIPVPAYFDSPRADTIIKKWNITIGSFAGTLYNKDSLMVTLNDGIGIYDSKGAAGKIKIGNFDPRRLLYVNHHPVYVDEENYVNFFSAAGLQKKQLLDITVSGTELRFLNNGPENNFFCIADDILYRVDIMPSGTLAVKKILTGLEHAVDIQRIYQKDSNTIVAGTIRYGLYVYKKQLFFKSPQLPAKEPDGFYVQQLLPDNQTILTGLDKLFKNNEYIGKTVPAFTTYNYSALTDRKGNYWYVSNDKLLRAKEPGINAVTMLVFKGDPGILFEDREQRVWFSSAGQLGYFKNDTFINVTVSNLNYALVSYIQQDVTGRHLIGTREGLYVLNSITNPLVNEVPAFHGYDIRFILPEANGQTWVCTYGQGLFLVNKEGGVTAFPESSGRLAYVHCIIEDTRGNFWMPTNSGLFVTSRESLMAYTRNNSQLPFYYRFSKTNGLRTNEFNGGMQPVYLRLPNGDISLASMQGLVRFHPDAIDFRFSASPILVDNIYLDSIEVATNGNLQVANDADNISFTISSSFWGQTGNDQLEYQLVPKGKQPGDNRWLDVDASGKINLFSPSYGDYQLVIRKRKGLQANDYIYKIVAFTVEPKWFQTRLFFICRAIFFLSVLTGVFFWRRSYYKKSNRVLKEKVTAATMELQQMNDTLEKKVEERTLAIKKEKDLSQSIINNLPGIFYIFDQAGQYQLWNKNFELISGYSAAEMSKIHPSAFIETTVLPTLQERVSKVFTEGYAELETAFITRDGRRIPYYFNGISVTYNDKPCLMGVGIDVSEQEKAKEQLVIEKNLSQSIINGLPGVFFIFDENHNHQLWNRNFEFVTGYNSAELKEKKAGTCIDEKDLLLFKKAVDKMFTTGKAEVEVTLVNRSKKRIPFYVNGIAITYEGKPCILGIGIDISERKKAEEERERANYLLNERIKELTTLYRAGLVLQEEKRSILVTLNDFVSVLPAGWQYTDITAACVTFGELEFATPNFKLTPFKQEATFATNKGNTGKITVVYLEERPQETEGPFLAEERKLIDMLADMLKVYLTKKEAVIALQQSEANLNTIFDTTDTVYALLNENFQVVAFNQRCADFSEKEFKKTFRVHTSFIDYFPQNQQASISENIKKVMMGRHISYEISYPQANGTSNWYYIRMFPITNTEKAVFGIMMALSDITEKKLLEQKILNQKVQEQKEVTRAILIGEEKERNKIGQELHDNINQILAGTKLYLGMARKAKENREEIINESMALLDSAIEEIRIFSKGKVTPMKKVNLEELLRLLIATVSDTTNIKTRFIYNGAGQLIEDDLKLNIYRIIQEQLNNILKHALAKSISVAVEAGNGFINVLVQDDGKGFDVNEKKSGVGLSNMINRVESFNGTITIESSPGNGCTTKINIPFA